MTPTLTEEDLATLRSVSHRHPEVGERIRTAVFAELFEGRVILWSLENARADNGVDLEMYDAETGEIIDEVLFHADPIQPENPVYGGTYQQALNLVQQYKFAVIAAMPYVPSEESKRLHRKGLRLGIPLDIHNRVIYACERCSIDAEHEFTGTDCDGDPLFQCAACVCEYYIVKRSQSLSLMRPATETDD